VGQISSNAESAGAKGASIGGDASRRAAPTERSSPFLPVLEQAPGFFALLRGPKHVVEFVSRAYVELTGGSVFLGRPVRDVFPEVEGRGFFERLDRVYATGERYTARHLRIKLARGCETETDTSTPSKRQSSARLGRPPASSSRVAT